MVVVMVAAFSYLFLLSHLRHCLAARRMHSAYIITLKTSTTNHHNDAGSFLICYTNGYGNMLFEFAWILCPMKLPAA